MQARIRAAVVLERRGAAAVFGSWRADLDLGEMRWSSGGQPTVLRAGMDRLLVEFLRAGDPATGLALTWAAQALVLTRLDQEPERR